MAKIAGRRMAAEIDGDFVVFLIGARLNFLHLAGTIMDLGGRHGMKHMLDYLVAHPEKGLLGYQLGLPVMVQYWRSFDHLEAFATDTEDPHLAVWQSYWKRVGNGKRTGIWHETYLVRAGEYEAIYANMPPFGLGKAGQLVPLQESSSARSRIKAMGRTTDATT
jgi:fumigallin biosynthesis monooxygenase-like protein